MARQHSDEPVRVFEDTNSCDGCDRTVNAGRRWFATNHSRLTLAGEAIKLTQMNVGENQSAASPVPANGSSTPAGKPSFKNPETLLLFLLAVFGLTLVWRAANTAAGIDFYQFWVVGQALRRSAVADVYSDAERSRLGAEFLEKARATGNPRQIAVAEFRQNLQTYSSPFLYAVFGLGSTGNYETDLCNYRVLLLACLVLGVVALCRLLNHSLNLTLGAVAIFSAWFDPFASDLRMGNVNTVQFALLAAYLWVVARRRWRGQDILGGAIIGLTVAFKPNLVLIAAVLAADCLLNRQYRRLGLQAAGAAAGGLLAVVVAAAGFGTPRCWTRWLSALRSLPDEVILVKNGNYAPGAMLGESVGANVGIALAVLFGGLVVVGLWMKKQGMFRSNETGSTMDSFSQVQTVAAGCLLVILIPRLAWLHYYVLAIPAFLVLLGRGGDLPFAGRPLLRQLLLVLAFLGLATDPFFNLGLRLTTYQQGTMAVCATLILFALTIFPQRRRLDPGRD
jgi:hypothetical protein